MTIFGQVLPPVQLRFNSASRFATDSRSRRGIQKFGPYDAGLFSQRQLTCGIIYSSGAQAERDALVNGLLRGDTANFPGFAPFFRVHLNFDQQLDRCIRGTSLEREFRQAATYLASRSCDLAFVITSRSNPAIYRACKAILLSNGIPCQVVTADKLRNTGQRPWILGNISLAAYAKVGGTPWVVADPTGGQQLVMGVSRAQDESKRYVVGFVTLFNQDGDFLLLHAKTPVVQWNDYVSSLQDLIIEAYQDYQTHFGTPQSLIIHFHKRPGYRELEAVNGALREIETSLPYALLHLNEFSLFRVFDTAHSSYIPPSGLQVDLSQRRALLLLDGLEGGTRSRRGVPNVWDISMDKRSTMSVDEFPHLVQQIHRFARVNWRGFNARSTPVTINYSKLICDLVLEIGVESWNSIIGNGKLREKAWFL